MRIFSGRLEVAETHSTQDLAAESLRQGAPVGQIRADHQTGGRGRRERAWESFPGDSLAISFTLDEAIQPAPYLFGMAAGVALAEELDCRLRWPNDLVVSDGEIHRKLGGILTEIVDGKPILGIGLNLNQAGFPEHLAGLATSYRLYSGEVVDPAHMAERVRLAIEKFPRPLLFAEIKDRWASRDRTPGKLYRLPDGRVALAQRVLQDGALLAEVDGAEIRVDAAEAIFDVKAGAPSR